MRTVCRQNALCPGRCAGGPGGPGPARARSLALPSSSCFCAHQLARIAHPFRRLPRRAGERASELLLMHAASYLVLMQPQKFCCFLATQSQRSPPNRILEVGGIRGQHPRLCFTPFLRMRSNILAFVRSSTNTTAIVHAPVTKGIEPNEGHYIYGNIGFMVKLSLVYSLV